MPAEEKFQKGIEQFNSRCFFEAHETWEEIWLAAPQPEKTFLQGLIQTAAAFHHYSRGNLAGTHSLLVSGLVKLRRFPADYRCLNLLALRAAAKSWVAALRSGRDPGPSAIPRIEQGFSAERA